MSSQTICLLEKLLGKQDLQISLESFHLLPYRHIQNHLAAGLADIKEVTLTRQVDKNSTLISAQNNLGKPFSKMSITSINKNAKGIIWTFQNPFILQVKYYDYNAETKEEILVDFTDIAFDYIAPKSTP